MSSIDSSYRCLICPGPVHVPGHRWTGFSSSNFLPAVFLCDDSGASTPVKNGSRCTLPPTTPKDRSTCPNCQSPINWWDPSQQHPSLDNNVIDQPKTHSRKRPERDKLKGPRTLHGNLITSPDWMPRQYKGKWHHPALTRGPATRTPGL